MGDSTEIGGPTGINRSGPVHIAGQGQNEGDRAKFINNGGKGREQKGRISSELGAERSQTPNSHDVKILNKMDNLEQSNQGQKTDGGDGFRTPRDHSTPNASVTEDRNSKGDAPPNYEAATRPQVAKTEYFPSMGSKEVKGEGQTSSSYQNVKKTQFEETSFNHEDNVSNESVESEQGELLCKTKEETEESKSNESSNASEMEERPAWDNKFQYIMAALGFAVGLGNIWRFPYLCQKNGGGAFLIPYFIMLFLEGYPLYFLELAVGQSIRKGAVGVWTSIDRHLVGVGFAGIVVSLLIGLYYNMILAWTMYYLVRSFTTDLPWAECPSDNGTAVHECAASSSTQYFWYRETLDISSTIEEGGTLNWRMVIALLVAWILVFCGIMKGIKSSGKVMYFATIFPYVILVAFFVRGMSLEGAAAGVIHMFKPDVTRLKDPVVWREAATQIFFSLGLGYGAIIAYSSYNPYRNNCKKDALFVATANSITSVFACITVFSILGFKAQVATKECMQMNRLNVLEFFPEESEFLKNSSYKDFLSYVERLNETHPETFFNISMSNKLCSIEEELKEIGQGTGLAFIAFAEAILSFPGAPVWAVLFFFMLLCIGMSSEFGILQGFITMVLDSPYKVSKLKLTSSLCFGMFLIGLVFTMRSGSYFLDIFDTYAATFGLVAIALCETVSISWVYGLDTFLGDINRMINDEPGWYWRISWKFSCPFIMVVILIASFVDMVLHTPKYSGWDPILGSKVELTYPPWAVFIIAILILSSILCIPIFALLVHYGKFDPKVIGVHPAGKNKRSEEIEEQGPSESATPLTLNIV